MKQGSIIKAYKLIQKLGAELDLPWELKRKLANFRRQMQPTWDFQIEQEQATTESLTAKYKKKPGETLTSEEIAQLQTELRSKLSELARTEVDIDIQPARITVDAKVKKVLNKVLTGNDFVDLDGFIEFEEAEGK